MQEHTELPAINKREKKMPNENTIVHSRATAVKNSSARFSKQTLRCTTKMCCLCPIRNKNCLWHVAQQQILCFVCVSYEMETHTVVRLHIAVDVWLWPRRCVNRESSFFSHIQHRNVYGYTLSCYALVVVDGFVHGPNSNRSQRLEFSYCFAMALWAAIQRSSHTCVRTCSFICCCYIAEWHWQLFFFLLLCKLLEYTNGAYMRTILHAYMEDISTRFGYAVGIFSVLFCLVAVQFYFMYIIWT